MKKRILKLATVCAVLFFGGCAYALFVSITGWGVPCVFYKLTGWQCPGCGVSRMLLCLLRLDIAGAWKCHPLLLCLLPVGAALGLEAAIAYVKYGVVPPQKWRTAVIWTMTVLLLLFGLLRNIM